VTVTNCGAVDGHGTGEGRWRPGTPMGHDRRMDRSARLSLALDRQDGRCVWCGREFGRLIVPTTDHLVPRLKGGPSISANEVAACRRCNADRGHIGPVDWLDQCRRRIDWSPQADLLTD